MRGASTDLLARQADDPDLEQALARLEETSLTTLNRMDRAVRIFQAAADARARRSLRVQVGLAIVASLALAMGFLGAKHTKLLKLQLARERAEEHLQETESRLAKQMAELEHHYRTAPVGLGMVDTDLRFVRINDSLAEINGVPAADHVGRTLREVIPDLADDLEPIYRRVIETGEPALNLELHGVTAAAPNAARDCLVSYFPLETDDAVVLGVTVVVQDITERKLAEQEIRELNLGLEGRVAERTAQLAATNRELEAFTYSVSHDLKAPLRAIDGFSAILTDDHSKHLDAEGLRVLDIIRHNAQQMGQLIDDLLTFSQVGRAEMSQAEIDMRELARSVFDELRSQTPERSIRLELEQLPSIQGDRTMIRQVFSNLIANAIKFAGPREQAVVEIGCKTEDGEHIFHVKDNGVGFDMQYVDKLFGVFQRLHHADEFPGTGVGLAIVQRMIGRHGGRVWAEGKLDEGATIHFTLPRSGKAT